VGSRLRTLALWLVFFAASFDLGYPILARYDPRKLPGTSDDAYYAAVAQAGRPPSTIRDHRELRLLVPLLAHPIAKIADGRVGQWDAVELGLLLVAAALVASTALVLSLLGARLFTPATGVLAGALYLLSFTVPNFHLAGLVDAGEAFALTAVAAALIAEKPAWVVPAALIGALAKESTVALLLAFAIGWLVVRRRAPSLRREAAWLALAIVVSAGAVALIHFSFAGHIVWPAPSERSFGARLVDAIAARQLLYSFFWLLPLGLWRVRALPTEWIAGAATAAVCALVLGALADVQGNTARPLFDAIGPMLALSGAALLAGPRDQ
jgi:hypothetical protein